MTLILLCVLVCAYTYVGYPVLVVLLARWFPATSAPVQSPSPPTVTVCLPVHDGARWLARKLASLQAQRYPAERLEIWVYADGCDDETVEIGRRISEQDARVRVLVGPVRAGKPTALNRLREVASGEILVLTDVRQPLDPGCVAALVGALADPGIACVSGDLRTAGASGAGIYSRYEARIRRAEARFRGMIGMNGPIYALRRADLPELPADTILDDVWVPMRLRLGGRRLALCEDAIAYDEAFDDAREFRRKVRTLAGNYQLFARMPELLSPLHNPSWFETVSHKLLRLVCPWALIVLALATPVQVLASWHDDSAEAWFVRGVALALSLAAGLALLGGRAGAPGRAARSFVVMNAAAIVGLWRFVRGTQAVTW